MTHNPLASIETYRFTCYGCKKLIETPARPIDERGGVFVCSCGQVALLRWRVK